MEIFTCVIEKYSNQKRMIIFGCTLPCVHYLNFISTDQKLDKQTKKVCQGSFNSASGSFKEVFEGSFKGISSLKSVSRKIKGVFMGNFRRFQGHFK